MALSNRRRSSRAAVAGVVLAMLGLLLAGTDARAGVAHPTVVSSTPVTWTPHLKTGGAVHENAVVGGMVYAGGKFTQFENSARTVTYNRQNFVAYSATTGAVSPLTLNFDGEVRALAGTPDGSALFVGGGFRNVNGATKPYLVKVNLATGTIDPTFKWTGGIVRDVQVANNMVYVAGDFAKRLVAANITTGADTGLINISVAGNVGGSATRVDQFGINPAGTDLVAIGNFTTVNGESRRLAFRLTLGATTTLQSWHPRRFDTLCASSIPYYLRGLDWSPDGTYFVIVSTGGPRGGYPQNGFCDGAGRWEASSSGSVAEPTWVNWTGGDSLYSVAVSGAAVYVGGHQRWLDNPFGHDSAGPGAYQVDSIGAIDPSNGLAIRSWSARPMTRGHGKEDLTLFAGGLVVGGDGQTVKGKYHRATAIFPLP